MQRLKPLVYKYGYEILRVYWFLFRPKTSGVRCVVLNKDKILLVRHTYGSHLWTTVGGGIKANEDLEQAVRREVKEEVGLELGVVKKVGEVQYEEEYKKDTVHVFLSDTLNTDLQPDNAEIVEASWFPVDELPEDVSPRFKKFLALAKNQIKSSRFSATSH